MRATMVAYLSCVADFVRPYSTFTVLYIVLNDCGTPVPFEI